MSNNTSTTANVSLGYLSAEAISLVEQAKKYRADMEKLPEGDSRRALYEQMIRDLLDRSRRISVVVTTTSGSST